MGGVRLLDWTAGRRWLSFVWRVGGERFRIPLSGFRKLQNPYKDIHGAARVYYFYMADDILDPSRARFYLWGAAGAADKFESAADAERVATPRGELRPREFAGMVQRVWAMADRGLQARATVGLAEHAERLTFELAGMPASESIQLIRLIVRHRLFIEPALYAKLPIALACLPFEAPELVDLLAEVANTGDSRLVVIMTLGMGNAHAALPGLGRRLLPILRAEGHFRERALAVTFAAWAQDWAPLIPELRRALGEPSLRLRVAALQGLLQKGGLREEDVQALLEDAVVHPPPDRSAALREDCHNYARALHQAVVNLRPREGHRPLLAIARNNCVFVRGLRELDESFALKALAAAYPQRALGEIDYQFASTYVWDRYHAVTASAELVDGLARPRLLRGLDDPDARVCEYARKLWFKRFGQEPSVEPVLFIPLEEGTGSESFGPRLTVLRGKDTAARLAMAKALLAAAPEREALALLLYALRDHSLWLGVRELGLPQSCDAWAQELCRCFGAPAFDGLLLLAEHQALAGVKNGWLSALAALPSQGLLDEQQRNQLRSLAQRVLLSSQAVDGCSDAVFALRAVGAAEACFDRLWDIALKSPKKTEAKGRWYNRPYTAYAACETLGQAGPNPALDARIESELSAALDRRSFEFAEGLIRIGIGRKDAVELLALTERALALCAGELALRSSTAPLELAARCVELLQARDPRAPHSLLGWLEHPENPLFIAAIQHVGRGCDWAVPALLGALESTALSGAIAARAAERRLCIEALDVNDARLDAVLQRAPLRDAMELATMMLCFGADFARVSHEVLDALCSSDEELAEAGVHALSCLREQPDIWSQALLRGVHPSIKEYAIKQAGLPSEAEQYWQDTNDEGDSQTGEGARAEP